jgi:Fe-S oxidoreductase
MIGRISEWLPAATKIAPIANFFMENRLFRKIASGFGLAPDVNFPKIATGSFQAGHVAQRLLAQPHKPENNVILWIDSFNNGFTPKVLEAGVVVLEKLGFSVSLIKKQTCCGRPYYDVGMIDKAKSNLEKILEQLKEPIEKQIPIVVLEPSCLSVFRDEMPGLFPNDERATRLKNMIMTLSEFIVSKNIILPEIEEDIRIHGHCHQKSCGGMNAEEAVLKNIGGKGQLISAGCCGVAGAYGYHAKSAPVAKKIGEEEFKPHIDKIPVNAHVVADGFSCRGQIKNVGNREALHFAELLARVLP